MSNSPYLDRPLLPLTVALPRMLEKIEADLATTGPTETPRLRQRAELIRDLLAPPGRSPIHGDLERAAWLSHAPQRISPQGASPPPRWKRKRRS